MTTTTSWIFITTLKKIHSVVVVILSDCFSISRAQKNSIFIPESKFLLFKTSSRKIQYHFGRKMYHSAVLRTWKFGPTTSQQLPIYTCFDCFTMPLLFPFPLSELQKSKQQQFFYKNSFALLLIFLLFQEEKWRNIPTANAHFLLVPKPVIFSTVRTFRYYTLLGTIVTASKRVLQ